MVDNLNTTEIQEYGFTDNGLFNATESVDDTTKHEYLYDPNGNLTADYNKQISAVQYNYLNLPTLVDLGNNNYIEYLYDAAGIKLRQKVYKDGGLQKETDYVGNFIYENSSLKFIITDDDRLLDREDGSGYDYEYFIKDHLGNNRVVVKDSLGFASVQQEDHYYPFGMTLAGQSWQNPLQKALNKYMYNGKELQDDLGLDWYDYGARFYDPVLGRFPNIDPIIEKFPEHTPYNYAFNNPSTKIDLYGLQGIDASKIFPSIVDRAINFVTNKINQAAQNFVKSATSAAGDVVRDVASKTSGSFYLEAGISAKAGAVGGTKVKNAGYVIDASSIKVGEASLCVANGKITPTIDYLGKNGEVTYSRGGSAGYSAEGLGADIAVSYSNTQKDGEGISTKAEGSFGAGLPNAAIESKVTVENNKESNSTKATAQIGLAIGGTTGTAGAFSYWINTGYRLTYDNKDDD